MMVLLKYLHPVDDLCVPFETSRETYNNFYGILDKEGKGASIKNSLCTQSFH